jgi:2-polyprenyl-3-methyl-5-hydroxy-6-metoxy-1,4-benzoquinol methylase
VLSHYHSTVNPDEENNSHAAMLRLVGFNKRVLEAGCASGHVSEFLHAQGCSVVGIELDKEVVQPALQWLERVVVGNMDDDTLWEELDGEAFDVVLFGDVLEHLRDPLHSLRSAVKHLRPSGTVVISVPNIAHADVKIALIKGTFPYRESGLLDSTHIHFFTKESLLELLKEAGLVVTEVCRVTVPVFGTEIGVQRGDVDDHVLAAIVSDRESETYQFVIEAVRDDGARSLTQLSSEMVELTDKLVDETRRSAVLAARIETLEADLATLNALREADQNELARLQRLTRVIKRFVPASLRRFVNRQISAQ